MTGQPTAFSYLRFSTPDQMKGDSFRRQTEAAQAYAEREGLNLDTELTFQDLGVSAFRGANVIDGALGQFIQAVDSGQVPQGSVLLVENLDRLSRDRIMPALNRFSDLLGKGIEVVTLSDGKRYDADSLKNLPDLMLSLLVMSRAHDESQLKSIRLSAAWQRKRERAVEEGHILTAKAPAWLQLKDGRFEVKEDRAAIVRRIFELATGGHGKAGIAYRLNEEGVPPFGDGPSKARQADGWHPSYIQKILRNPAVIGHYQPMHWAYDQETGKRRRKPDGPAIEGYFPPIVDETTYYRVKHSRPGVSGHKGKTLANRLSGLVFCAICGGKLHYVNKGPRPKGGQYLACDNARRKKTCHAKSVRYDLVWGSVLTALERPHLATLFGASSGGRKSELANKIAELDGLIAETDQSVGNLLDILQRRPSGAVEQRLADQEAALASLRAEREALDTQLQSEPTGEDWRAVVGTMEKAFAMEHDGEPTDPEWLGEGNVRWNANLKRIVERVDAGLDGLTEALAVIVTFRGDVEPVKVASYPIEGGGWTWPKRWIEDANDGWGDFEHGLFGPDAEDPTA